MLFRDAFCIDFCFKKIGFVKRGRSFVVGGSSSELWAQGYWVRIPLVHVPFTIEGLTISKSLLLWENFDKNSSKTLAKI